MGGVVFLATAPTQSPSLPCSCNSGEESLGFYEVWRAHIHKGRAPVTVTLRPAVLAVVVGECSGVPAFSPSERMSWGDLPWCFIPEPSKVRAATSEALSLGGHIPCD